MKLPAGGGLVRFQVCVVPSFAKLAPLSGVSITSYELALATVVQSKLTAVVEGIEASPAGEVRLAAAVGQLRTVKVKVDALRVEFGLLTVAHDGYASTYQ